MELFSEGGASTDGCGRGSKLAGHHGPRGREKPLAYNKDFLLLDTHARSSGSISGPIVFVGYGVTAPEFQYDDYAGVDAKVKSSRC